MRASPSDDLYAVLGVEEGVDARTLRAAYLARMRVHHPDRQPGDPGDTARRLNLAYEVLRDPLRRAEYDRARRAAGRSSAPTSPGRPGGATGGRDAFGGGVSRNGGVRAPRGARTVADPAYSEDNQRYAQDLTRRLVRGGIAIAALGLVLLVVLALTVG